VLRTARAFVVGATVLIGAGCTVAVVETPDPAAIPSGEPVAEGAQATGPITVLGSGQMLGLGWRYAMYESADGWCTQLEMVELTATGCGDPLPAGGDHIGGVSVGNLSGGVTTIDGIVTEEIFTVWIVDQNVGRIPATLLPLDEAGLEGQAFVAFMPADTTPTHVQALALSGEVLDTYEVP
jgi:hypothetical protein